MCPPTETGEKFELAAEADLVPPRRRSLRRGLTGTWFTEVVFNTLFWVIVPDTLWELLP